MFAKKFRLPSRISTLTFSVLQTSLFVLKYHKNDIAINRFGFVSSKKIDKRAVYRNRVRRQLRGLLEELNYSLPQGYDILFILKAALKEKTVQQIKEILIINLIKALV